MRLLFLSLFAMVASSAIAQDVIIQKTGDELNAKVTKVTGTEIEYKKWSNLNGPVYTLPKSDVFMIKYQNGDKDVFNENAATTLESDKSDKSDKNDNTTTLVQKEPDSRNKEIIALYDKIYEVDKEEKDKYTDYCVNFYALDASSLVSNDEIEMTIEARDVSTPYDVEERHYYIMLQNKTDKSIYVDLGNCFEIKNDGTFYCYYDGSETTTVSNGGSSGGGVALGSVAGALGIGGIVGQIASGINLGGESSNSISTSYSSQRFFIIPPHAKKALTEDKWVRAKKSEYKNVGHSETFENDSRRNDKTIRKWQLIRYNWATTPYKGQYIITYSTENDFSKYSTLTANFYIKSTIGFDFCYNIPKHIENIEDKSCIYSTEYLYSDKQRKKRHMDY